MANEKRLIDAKALAENVYALTLYVTGLRNGKTILKECMEKYRNAVLREICKAPTVDAVEVVHGRWNTEKCDHVPWRLKNPEKWVICKCSVCGYSNGRKKSNYCPNCGAKMDGGNEDG